jgi:hypothetical protein
MRGRFIWCMAQYQDGEAHGFSVPEDHLRRGDFILKSLASEHQRHGLLPPGQIDRAWRSSERA